MTPDNRNRPWNPKSAEPPSAEVPPARSVAPLIRLAQENCDELSEQATLLAAQCLACKLYLERALAGVEAYLGTDAPQSPRGGAFRLRGGASGEMDNPQSPQGGAFRLRGGASGETDDD